MLDTYAKYFIQDDLSLFLTEKDPFTIFYTGHDLNLLNNFFSMMAALDTLCTIKDTFTICMQYFVSLADIFVQNMKCPSKSSNYI